MAIDVTEYASKERLLEAMEARLRAVLSASSEHPFAVLISGGNTPLPVYTALAHGPPATSPQAGIAFADDRHVPASSPESNFGNARPMIESLGIPAGQTLRVHTELPLEEAADRYHRDLDAFLSAGGTIPLAFLGLGADGHTCSLFTGEDLERGAGRLAAPVYKTVPPNRITVTPDLLSRVEQVVFIVAGNDKMEVVAALLEKPETLTAGKAVAGCPSVALWRA